MIDKEVVFVTKEEFAPILGKYRGLFHHKQQDSEKYRYPKYTYYGEQEGKVYVRINKK